VCCGWREDVNGLALYKDFSGVWKMRAAEYFDKGTLAGYVFANEAQDLAVVQFHGNLFQCMHAGKRFINLAYLQEE